MFPNFQVVATTLRKATTATLNDWGAIVYADGAFHEAPLRENLEIFDRVGGGDSFASGLDLRLPGRQVPAGRRPLRRRPRRPGHDHARRHQHGHAQGSRGRHEGQRRPGDPVKQERGAGM